MARKRINEARPHPKDIQNSFISNLEGIEIFIKNVEPVVAEYDQKASLNIKMFKKLIKDALVSGIKENAKDDIGEGNNIQIDEEKAEKATEDILQIMMKYNRLPKINTGQVELLYKSAFVLLTAFLDYLIHDVIHCYYKMYPESLPDRDKELSISLSDLKLCSDRDEAIDIIIDKKVDSILYGNLTSQKTFIKEQLHLDIGESIVKWDIINESIERRNIIVHNDCIVNKRYLRSVELSIIPEGKRLKEGERVSVGAEYFKRVHDEIIIAGITIIQSCWRKWLKDDLDEADKSLILMIYNLLKKEEWSVTEKLGHLSKGMKVYDSSSRNILDINYCQSLKWQGRKAELREELSKFDESNLSPRFKVGLAALKNDKENFYKYSEQAVAINEIDEAAFHDWPLFRELRQDAEYEDKIKAIMQKKYDADKK